MSGLVSGLQNRVRRFESARNLLVIENYFSRFYFGSLDEWLSQWSAKPCTAVRIRQEPRRKASKLFVMNASRLFLFCPSVTLAGLSGGSLFSWLPLAGSLGGFVVFLLRYSSSNGCCMIVHHPLHDHATDGGRSCNRWWTIMQQMVDNECLKRKGVIGQGKIL